MKPRFNGVRQDFQPNGLNTYAAYHVLYGGLDPWGLSKDWEWSGWDWIPPVAVVHLGYDVLHGWPKDAACAVAEGTVKMYYSSSDGANSYKQAAEAAATNANDKTADKRLAANHENLRRDVKTFQGGATDVATNMPLTATSPPIMGQSGRMVRNLNRIPFGKTFLSPEKRAQLSQNTGTVPNQKNFGPGAAHVDDPALRGRNPVREAGDYRYNPAKDSDLRGTGTSYHDALADAFKKTGVPKDQFEITKWGKCVNGKSWPVEWRVVSGPNRGAEVNVDLPHTNQGPAEHHIGWQSPGKRSSGGAERGHIIMDNVPAGR